MPTPLDQIEQADIMATFRKVSRSSLGMEPEELLREVAKAFGYQRLGAKMKIRLQGDLHAAKIRRIIQNDNGLICPAAPTIQHYEDDDLIKTLRSVIRKGYEYPRDHLVEAAAKHLGFETPGDAFKKRIKSVFRKAIRRGVLYRNGEYVGKV